MNSLDFFVPINPLEVFNSAMGVVKYVPKELVRSSSASILFLQLKTLKSFENYSEEFLTELYDDLILLRTHWKPIIDMKESKLIKRIALWFKMSYSKQLLSQDSASKRVKRIDDLVKGHL